MHTTDLSSSGRGKSSLLSSQGSKLGPGSMSRLSTQSSFPLTSALNTVVKRPPLKTSLLGKSDFQTSIKSTTAENLLTRCKLLETKPPTATTKTSPLVGTGRSHMISKESHVISAGRSHMISKDSCISQTKISTTSKLISSGSLMSSKSKSLSTLSSSHLVKASPVTKSSSVLVKTSLSASSVKTSQVGIRKSALSSQLEGKKSLVADTTDSSEQIPIVTKQITEHTDGAPMYNFAPVHFKVEKKPLFASSENDASLQPSPSPAVNIVGLKMTLLNGVATSLLSSPDFRSPQDPAHIALSTSAKKLSHHDPEFILKLALYTRVNLNIRTTANFLLALAANLPSCRPYLRKYYSASIKLPSDWIEVAEIYQAFQDKAIKFGAIPKALRKVMETKFTQFDAYQLAKYNKDSSKKKKQKVKKDAEKTKKQEEEKKKREEERKKKYAADFPALNESASESESDESSSSVVVSESETKEEIERLSFTLKQLIRKVHISEPVEYIMCLLGKKYPEDAEAFRKSRLPGLWDQDRANKRMKLPVPETWETQVSTKGNKASTWEDLIDHSKLPFMAMLRNLRNLILAGISAKHHQWVIKKLNDERAVVNSKQFPFRFFSAYDVLQDLEKVADGVIPEITRPQRGGGKKKKKPAKNPVSIDKKILKKYKTALDSALKIATCYNVKPISGSTLILCNVGNNMDRPCTSARGLGKPRKVFEVGVLLGLMCKYSCEKSTMLIYGQGGLFSEVELEEGTILHNMDQVMSAASNLKAGDGIIPSSFLTNMLIDRQPVDNIVLLTDAMKLDDQQGRSMMDFLQKYRHLVNPDLLFVSVDLSGRSSGISSTILPEHPNDIYLAGYSDQILRFIAERGDSGQLTYVDNIDKAFNLTGIVLPSLAESAAVAGVDHLLSLSSEKMLLSATQGQKWRTVRVFISSTFKDMHGERDLLTRFIFPELRARAHSRHIHVYEVDLRWGVTEQDARSHKALEICLDEISRSQYFIGLLGQRYGWIQDEYNVPDTPEFDWLKEFPTQKSITEVEMYYAALCNPDKATDKAFFYFRDPAFLDKVPPQYKTDFESESEVALQKIEDLKSEIRTNGLEVYDNYSCKWLGKVQDKLMVGGLESFGQRILHNLWNAIQRDYPEGETYCDAISQATAEHNAFEEARSSSFIGRHNLLQKARTAIEDPENKLVLVTGKPGCGKSAFMAALAQQCKVSQSTPNLILSHFVGAAPGSSNIAMVLTRLCHEMNRRFGIGRDVPEDYTDLARDWANFLEDSVANVGKISSKIIILIDGIDLLEDKYNGRSLDWIPEEIPEGAVILLSGLEGSMGVTILKKRKPPPSEIIVGPLDMYDKAEMVRKKLSKHRKTLDESPFNNQMKLLLTKKEAVNPLYLHLACEELRVFGVFEEVTAYLKKMPTNIASLLQEILQRLESEHALEILSTSLNFLTLVRNGLLEHELAGLLELALRELLPEYEGNLPPMVMSRLLRSLQTFLQPTGQETTNLLTLAHKDIEKAVKLRYMRGAASSKEGQLHMLLARFFREEADPLGDLTFKGNSARAFRELPYHLMEAGAWKELEQVVCNIHFVVGKCCLGLAQQLLEDYMPVTSELHAGKGREIAKFIQQPMVTEFKSFVSRNLHILLKNPSLALQQAVNEPTSSAIASTARDIVQENRNMMLWCNKPEHINPCQMSISSQTGPVLCVDVSLDSSLFVAGFKNGAVRVYKVSTGKDIHTFIGHAGGITDVCFVGSHSVCSASHDTTLSLWDTKQGIRIATLKGHSRGVHGCAAERSGKNIVSVSWDTTTKLWDGKSGKLLHTLKTQGHHNTPINCVSFHPEGQLVVVGSWDTTLKIWDTFNQKRLKVLKGHRSSVQACTYAPSGRHIVSAALDGEVKVWSTKSGTAVGTITGHHSPVNDIAFTPNGQYLVTGSSDKVIKVWSGSLGRPITTIGSANLGFVHQLTFDHDNQLVGVGYHDGHVRQFNIQTGAEIFTVRPHSAAIVGLAHHGNLYMSASADQFIKIWDITSFPKSIELQGHTSPLTCAVWNKNGCASASEDFSILVWPHQINVYTKMLMPKTKSAPARKRGKVKISSAPKEVVDNEQELVVKPLATLQGKHTGKITSIAYSCDGTKMVAVSHDRSISVWDCLSYQLVKVLDACHKDWITTCTFSDISSDILITGSSDFTLKVWDVTAGKEKLTFKGHTSAINSVAFIQGCVVSAAFDGSVKVWTHRGVEITTMFCHKQRVNASLLYVPSRAKANQMVSSWADVGDDDADDMKAKTELENILVLTGSDDGTVGVWKPFLPNEITALIGHSDRVLSVATTLNNQFLSSSLDGSIRMWNPPLPTSPSATITLVNISMGHTGMVTSLSVLSIGNNKNYVISGGRDGYVVVWKIVEGEVTKVYRVKNSEKAVSSVCLISFKNDSQSGTFAVGDDSGVLTRYKFSQKEFPSITSSIEPTALMGSHPLSKLVMSEGPNGKYVVAGSWSNQIIALKKVRQCMKTHKGWVMDLIVVRTQVYSIALDGNLCCWSPSNSTNPSSSDVTKYPLHLNSGEDRNLAWPLSLCEVQGTEYLAISDSKGQVSLWNKETKRVIVTKKLHAGQVNALAPVSDGCFLSGSDDSTVKVWKVEGRGRATSLTQIGQFYGQSCITAISCMKTEGKNHKPMFVVGDSLGHVILLQWQQ